LSSWTKYVQKNGAWNKDQTGLQTFSEESRQKMSLASKGRKHSEESKQRMSRLRTEFLLANPDHHFCNYKSSKSERRFADRLTEWSINFIPQFNDPKWNRAFKADFYLLDYNCIIEVNGTFKYRDGKLDQYYLDRSAIIESAGYKILNINHHEAWFLSKEEIFMRMPD
jgi:very-short-patch-repair endonuclease